MNDTKKKYTPVHFLVKGRLAGPSPQPDASRKAHAEPQTTPAHKTAAVAEDAELDDADMVVIEDDLHETEETSRSIFSVRPGDYRSLFTRLRRGDSR